MKLTSGSAGEGNAVDASSVDADASSVDASWSVESDATVDSKSDGRR